VQGSARVVAALAISAYLVATLLPCEPPAWLARSGDDVHGYSAAPVEAQPTPHHAHHPTHHGDGDAAAAPVVTPRRSPTDSPSFLPKCLCGCSETRGWVGGSGARLGSVVAGVALHRFVETTPVVAVDRHRARFVATWLEAEPIPI